MILAVTLATGASVQAQTTALFLDSQPDDYVGQGTQRTYTPGDCTFQISRNYRNGVNLGFASGDRNPESAKMVSR